MIQRSIDITERAFGDEFYVRKFLEASTYAFHLNKFLTIGTCIVLALLLTNPWLSFIPFIAFAAAQWTYAHKLRSDVPQEKTLSPFSPGLRASNALFLALCVIWILILGIREHDGASVWLPAIAGAMAALLLAPYIKRRQHDKDEARINRKLDDASGS